MRSTLTAALIALFLFPAATIAQTATQAAAVDNAAPAASAPAVGSSMNSPTGGITRDQFHPARQGSGRTTRRGTLRPDGREPRRRSRPRRDPRLAQPAPPPCRGSARPTNAAIIPLPAPANPR